MKKIALTTLAVLTLSQAQVSKINAVVLTSPIIGLIDGKSYAIDGEVFGLILQVRQELRKILFGVKAENGQFVGTYELEEELYSVSELSILETQLKTDYEIKMEELNQTENPDTETEYLIKKTQNEYEERIHELKNVLNQAKEDFLEKTSSYIESIRGFKKQILMLIDESCEKRDKKDCFLRKWGEETEGNEGHFLRQEIKTFKSFETFCTDLTNFLEDMARSCPRGKELFIELMRKSKNS